MKRQEARTRLREARFGGRRKEAVWPDRETEKRFTEKDPMLAYTFSALSIAGGAVGPTLTL